MKKVNILISVLKMIDIGLDANYIYIVSEVLSYYANTTLIDIKNMSIWKLMLPARDHYFARSYWSPLFSGYWKW